MIKKKKSVMYLLKPKAVLVKAKEKIDKVFSKKTSGRAKK